jgi:broad specificity phosphatase PhoE
MPTVLLIRHGESMANKGLPSLNPKTVPLSVKGKKQAREIARRLKSQPLDLIITSSYLRSKETAQPTMEALWNVPVVKNWPVHEFTYLDGWKGEYSTIKDRKPIVNLFWQISDPIQPDPNAESFQQFIERVWDVRERLEKPRYREKTIAIFTHEQFISAFRWLLDLKRKSPYVDEYDMRRFRRYLLENPVANGEIVRLKLRTNISSLSSQFPVPV